MLGMTSWFSHLLQSLARTLAAYSRGQEVLSEWLVQLPTISAKPGHSGHHGKPEGHFPIVRAEAKTWKEKDSTPLPLCPPANRRWKLICLALADPSIAAGSWHMHEEVRQAAFRALPGGWSYVAPKCWMWASLLIFIVCVFSVCKPPWGRSLC